MVLSVRPTPARYLLQRRLLHQRPLSQHLQQHLQQQLQHLFSQKNSAFPSTIPLIHPRRSQPSQLFYHDTSTKHHQRPKQPQLNYNPPPSLPAVNPTHQPIHHTSPTTKMCTLTTQKCQSCAFITKLHARSAPCRNCPTKTFGTCGSVTTTADVRVDSSGCMRCQMAARANGGEKAGREMDGEEEIPRSVPRG